MCHTMLMNSSFRGRWVFSSSRIRARNFCNHLCPILSSHQESFNKVSLHFIDFAHRRSILCKRCNHITQLLDVRFYTSLQDMLLFVYHKPAIKILEDLVFADWLPFFTKFKFNRSKCIWVGRCLLRYEKDSFLVNKNGHLRYYRGSCWVHSVKNARIIVHVKISPVFAYMSFATIRGKRCVVENALILIYILYSFRQPFKCFYMSSIIFQVVFILEQPVFQHLPNWSTIQKIELVRSMIN